MFYLLTHWLGLLALVFTPSASAAYVYAEFDSCEAKNRWQQMLGDAVTHASCERPFLQWQAQPGKDWYQLALQDPAITWLVKDAWATLQSQTEAEASPWHADYLNLPNSPRSCSGVTIVVVDTGVDPEHPALAAVLEDNTREQYNASDDDGDGFCDNKIGWNLLGSYNANLPEPDASCQQLSPTYNDYRMTDNSGHGTHVSGLVAANVQQDERTLSEVQTLLRQKAQGVCTSANMVVINMLGAWPNLGGTSAHIENAMRYIEYLVDSQPWQKFVINHSWTISDGQLAALDRFERLGNNPNVLMVAAAGNSGRMLDGADLTTVRSMPAALNRQLPNVLSIGNLCDSDCELNRFSNHGWQSVDIALPGTKVASTWRDGQYASQTGTSMAAPIATGLASWLWTEHPNLSAAQVKASLLNAITHDKKYPVRYAGTLNTEQLFASPQPIAVFRVEELSDRWRLHGEALEQVDGATWNGQTVELTSQQTLIFDKRPAGRLELFSGGNKVASIHLAPSFSPPEDMSWQIDNNRVGVSWQPNPAYSKVELQVQQEDSQQWTLLDTTTGHTISAYVPQAKWQKFRLQAYSEGLDGYGEVQVKTLVSDVVVSSVQNKVQWQTLELASMQPTEIQHFALSTYPVGTISLITGDTGVALTDDRLTIDANQAPVSLRLDAAVDQYASTEQAFSLSYYSDYRRLQTGLYSQVLWPFAINGLQIRRDVITGQVFAWGQLPVEDGQASLVLKPLASGLTFYLGQPNNWSQSADESTSQYWQTTITDGSALDLDDDPLTITVAVLVTQNTPVEDARCFIATALHSSDKNLVALRDLRDRWLPKRWVEYYYHQSPYWIEQIEQREHLKRGTTLLISLIAQLYTWRYAVLALVLYLLFAAGKKNGYQIGSQRALELEHNQPREIGQC